MQQPSYDPSEDWDAGVRAYFEAAFGKEHFGRMAAALLRPPLGSCLRINPLRTTPEVIGSLSSGAGTSLQALARQGMHASITTRWSHDWFVAGAAARGYLRINLLRSMPEA